MTKKTKKLPPKIKKDPFKVDFLDPGAVDNDYEWEETKKPNIMGFVWLLFVLIFFIGVMWVVVPHEQIKPQPAPTAIVPQPTPAPTPPPEPKAVLDPDNSGHHLRWYRDENGLKHYFWRDDNGAKHWWPEDHDTPFKQ